MEIGRTNPSYYDYDVNYVTVALPIFEDESKGIKIVGGSMKRNLPLAEDRFHGIGIIFKYKIY